MLRVLFADVISGRVREAEPEGTSHLKPLPLSLIKMIAQDGVNEIGLWDLARVGFSLDQDFVVVRNDNLLVFLRKGPRAYVTIEHTAPAGTAFDVVTLLTKWLPVAEIIEPPLTRGILWSALSFTSGSCAPQKAHLYPYCSLSLCQSARSTFPWAHAFGLCPSFAAGIGFLPSDRSKALFTLQLPHTAENVFVGQFALGSKSINRCANIIFRQKLVPEYHVWAATTLSK